MCGIGGYFTNQKSGANLKDIASAMSQLLKHRGPDDEGFLFINHDNECIRSSGRDTAAITLEYLRNRIDYRADEINYTDLLGFMIHRRLSIIDLSPNGHQPMKCNNSQFWVSFNGEIYNYIELRSELLTLGYRFESQTDTEVFITAYKHWGIAAFDKFNGMWAAAIFDSNTSELLLCRDRLGVKPLNYRYTGNEFYFSSEQKAIVKLPHVKASINHEAVFDLFTVGRIESGQEDFFEQINELKPGHFLKFNTDNFKISEQQQWFHFKPLQENTNSLAANTDQLFQLVQKAVELRMRADVEVGTCLSGGLDSSSILSLMNILNKNNNTLNAFTALFNDSSFNEYEHAKIVAEKSNAIWHKTYPDFNGLISNFETLTYCQDVPLWSTSTFAQLDVMRSVKESGIKVVLDGQGGDELFGGYHSHRLTWSLEQLNKLNIADFRNAGNKLSSELLRFYLRNFIDHHFSPALRLKSYQKAFPGLKFLKQDFLENYKYRFNQLQPLPYKNLRDRLDAELFGRNLKSYLITEDRCSMWYSVESRTPFADDIHLIDFVRNLKNEMLIHKDYNKYLFRLSMKGTIPESIRTRKDKLGFHTPNNKWVSQMAPLFKEMVFETLPDSIFDKNALAKNYDSFFSPKSEKEDASQFKFLSFAMWMKVFFSASPK